MYDKHACSSCLASGLSHCFVKPVSHFRLSMAGIVFCRSFDGKRSKNLMRIMTSHLRTNVNMEFLHYWLSCKNCDAKISDWRAKTLWWDGSKFSFTSDATTVRNVHREWRSSGFSEYWLHEKFLLHGQKFCIKQPWHRCRYKKSWKVSDTASDACDEQSISRGKWHSKWRLWQASLQQ